MRFSKDIFKAWLPIAVAVTGVIGTAYVLVQQDMRLSANDPQMRIAEDAATLLAKGRPVQLVVSDQDPGLDLLTSLSPFLAVYDASGTPISRSMTLDGAAPKPPAGVFAYAKAHGLDTVSWQPRPDVRQSLIVMPYTAPDGTTGFVAAGRSLRVIERRTAQARTLALAAWLATLAASLIACAIVTSPKKPETENAP